MAAISLSQPGAGFPAHSSRCSNVRAPSPSSARKNFSFMNGLPSPALRTGSRQSKGTGRCQCNALEDDSREIAHGEESLLSMKSISAKKLEEFMESDNACSSQDDKWKRWQAYFPKVEEEENLITAMKFQLEVAVKSENFQEAAKLKKAIEAAQANDVFIELNKELQRALREERYVDAARLRDEAGAGLVGWWAGISKDGNDPFGRIINVKAAHGRLIARTYSPMELAQKAAPRQPLPVQASTPGNPLFEVFVRKETNGFNKQAVYLQREASLEAVDSGELDKLVDVDVVAEEEDEVPETPESDPKPGGRKMKKNEGEEGGDEAYQDASEIVEFLKDRIPDFNMRVIKVVAPEGTDPDIPKIIEDIIKKEQEQQQGESGAVTGGVASKQPGDKPPGSPEDDDNKALSVRVVIGGASPSDGGDGFSGPAVRVPATITRETKDSFLLHIDSISDGKDSDELDRIAAAATKAAADKMPDEVARKLWNVKKVPTKVSREIKEAIKLAVSHARGFRSLPRTTVFQRVDVTETSDPLTGLYVGAFGASAPEIIQLRRKFGHWDTEKGLKADGNLKFHEYVEAVKLTGDMNVPAGQVSFRAKVNRESKQSPAGVYPEELGVIARYQGQGQLAEPGFKNPKWTDGELVLLDGRRTGPAQGAKLGFVFYLPDHHFLILFDRLKLEGIEL